MAADLYIAQGTTHPVCQDYAATRVDADITTVIVSDGCSNSPHTDIGARLLTRMALSNIHRLDLDVPDFTRKEFLNSSLYQAEAAAKGLLLPQQCLDATLLVLKSNGTRFLANIFGDGAIAIGYQGGSVQVISLDYYSNAPRYLSYDLNPERRKLYSEKLERDSENYPGPRVVHNYWVPYSATENDEDVHPLMDDVVGREQTIIGHLDEPDVLWVGAITDGFKSFTHNVTTKSSKGQEPVNPSDVLQLMFSDFNNLRGKFVERQMKWFYNECDLLGWKHTDDFTFAAISFEP